MSRAVSSISRAAFFAPETEQVFLALLTIDHANLEDPIRVVNNNVSVISRGDEYVGYPFKIDLPGESGEELSHVKLQIDNVHRDIVYAIRTIPTSPSISLEIMRATENLLSGKQWGNYAAAITHEDSNEVVRTGLSSHKFILTSFLDGIAIPSISTVAGEEYCFVCWVYPETATSIQVGIHNGTGAQQIHNQLHDSLTPGEWNKISVTVTETATGGSAQVYLANLGTSAGTFYVDDWYYGLSDTVEVGPFDFKLKNVTYDSLAVEGDLMFENILDEPYPGDCFLPSTFPGLF